MESPRKKHTVLYDSDCPLCTFQMRLLTWLDWFNKVDLRPINAPEAAAIAPHLTREHLQEAIHCITPSGEIHRGARALRFLGLRMPALIPMGLILWFPGVILVAEKVYMWISRNRQLLQQTFRMQRGLCADAGTEEKTVE